MLNSAGLSGKYENLCHGLWAKCANMAMKLANIAAPSGKEPPHFQFFKTTLSFISNLHVFGEIGVVNDAAPLRSKLANHDAHCMFIGYAEDHASGTFKMFNLKTNHIRMMHDNCWGAANIGKYDAMSNNPLTKKNDEDNDDDDDNIIKTRTHAQASNNDDDDNEDEDNDDDNDEDDDNNDIDNDDNGDKDNDVANKDEDIPPRHCCERSM